MSYSSTECDKRIKKKKLCGKNGLSGLEGFHSRRRGHIPGQIVPVHDYVSSEEGLHVVSLAGEYRVGLGRLGWCGRVS